MGVAASRDWGQSGRSLNFLDCFSGLLVCLEGQSMASSDKKTQPKPTNQPTNQTKNQLSLQELSGLSKNPGLGFCSL